MRLAGPVPRLAVELGGAFVARVGLTRYDARDLLAVSCAGAYRQPLVSNYNARPWSPSARDRR